jgi:hypothetical protein
MRYRADPIAEHISSNPEAQLRPLRVDGETIYQPPTAVRNVHPSPLRARTLCAARPSPWTPAALDSLWQLWAPATSRGRGRALIRKARSRPPVRLVAWYPANKVRCMLRPLDAVLRRCAGAGHSSVASYQPSDPLASPPVHQSPVRAMESRHGPVRRRGQQPANASASPRKRDRTLSRFRANRLDGRITSRKDGKSGSEDAQDTSIRDEQRHAPCVRRSLLRSSVNHVCVTVASRRRTRIVLGCGGLDDGSSVPSPCTLSTGSSERMREGCVRDLGAKHIVTDEAQGRRAATGSSATSMFIIRRRTGHPTCLNHGACRPTPSARRRRTPAAHRQRQPEPGAGIDDFPGKKVGVLGAKEQSRMRGEDVTLPLEVQPRWRSAKDNAPAASYSLDSLSRRDGACHPTLAARRRRSPVARRHLEPSPAPERRLVHTVRRQARG